MWNPFRNKQKEVDKAIENLANLNLYQYIGNDLPLINSDGFDYINSIWKKIGVVYECTDLIQKKVAKTPILFYKVKNKSKAQQYKSLKDKTTKQAILLKAQSYEEIEPSSALFDLINNPNPQQNLSNFIGIFVLSYLITGNSYTWKNMSKSTNRPLEMWAFNQLTINSGGTYNPVKSYTQFCNTDLEKEYPADQIYHAKTPNLSFDQTGSQLYGVSPLRAFLNQLRTIEESHNQAGKQMKNGSVLALLSPTGKEDQLTHEQRSGFMDALKKGLRSNQDFSRFMISSIPMTTTQIGLPSADLDLLNIREADEQAIYRLFGVPLQFYSQESSSYNNSQTAVKKLVLDAVAPMCDILSDMLTNFIGVHFNDTVIQLDYTQLEDMNQSMEELVKGMIPLVEKGVISRDEMRFALRYGETGIDFMKDFWFNDKPLSKIYDGTLQPNGASDNENKQGA